MTTNTTVTHAGSTPRDHALSAALKIGTVTALLDAWIDKDGALDTSHLLAPLHTQREAEAELLNIEWSRVHDGRTP